MQTENIITYLTDRNNPAGDSPKNYIKFLSILTALLVFLVAVGSFSLSYSALREVALTNGITGWLSYVWPLLIDFALIVFSLSVVSASLQSEQTWKQWVLVGVYTLATIGFNVLHAPDNLKAQIVASIAPVSLFFSFELLMSQLRGAVNRQGITHNISQLSQLYQELKANVSQKRQELEELINELETLKAESQAGLDSVSSPANDTTQNSFKLGDTEALNRANETRKAQVMERREKVLGLLNSGRSQSDIANQLGVSIATIKRDAKALNGRVS